ncbi:MAG: alpha/beta hydrolase [Pseudomonadales bacterium]
MAKSWQSYVFNGLLRLRRRPLVHARQIEKLKRQLAKIDAKRKDSLPSNFTLKTVHNREQRNGIPVDWLSSTTADHSQRLILYLHGGAFCLHAPNIYRGFLAQLCAATSAVGVLPDYRLAPLHPYPAAAFDCFKVYQQLLEQGHDPNNIAIAGDSAGGNLTLTTLLQIKQNNLPMPACAAMLSPAADATFSGRSYFENAGKDPMFHVASMLFFRDYYLQGALPTDTLASPLTQSFSGYPPLYASVGSTELLRDTAVAIAQNARRDDVDAELDIWQGTCHVHQLMDFLPESKPAVENIVSFINRHWQTAHSSQSLAANTQETGEARQTLVG